METKLTRYKVYADGTYVSSHFDKVHAQVAAGNYVYECINQDEPYFPVMEIREEQVNGD